MYVTQYLSLHCHPV